MSYIGSFIYDKNLNKAYVLFDEGRLMDDEGDYTYEYFLKDHLGNTRVSFTKDGTLVEKLQEDHYYPFGMTFQGVNNIFTSPENKYKYNGKELQDDDVNGNKLNLYDYGARFYDAALGRFFVQDRFAEKYESMSPYQYVANNPILNIDINGDSIVVLNAPKGAHRAGHMAMLIQNEDGSKWRLWSKNGTQDNGGLSGENNSEDGDDTGVEEFDSPEAFMESLANTVIDEETGEREYSEGYLIASTSDEDRAAEGGARSVLDENYNVLESSCSTMVQNALQAAGKQDGSPSTLSSVTAATVGAAVGGSKGSALASIINKKTPRIIYERIKKQNKGTVIK